MSGLRGASRYATISLPLNRPALTSILAGLERHLLAALAAAAVAAQVLVARNGLLPVQHPTTFAAEFWKWIAIAYLAVALVAFLVVWLPLRWFGRERLAHAVVVLECAAFVAAAVVFNKQGMLAALQPDAAGILRWGPPLGVGLAAAALVAAAMRGTRAAWAMRVLTACAVAITLLTFRPIPLPRPPSGSLPPTAPTPPLFVVGLDGADWAYVDALVARGELPNLARLRAGGAWGELGTLRPTLSPAIWTTVATGVIPRRHGVRGFTAERIGDIDETLPPLHPLRGLLFRGIIGGLRERRYIRDRPISSASRKVPAFWNLATAHGLPVDVVDWWATAPAEPVLGHVVSDRTFFEELMSRGRHALPAGLAHPPELAREVSPLIVLPDDVTLEEARRYADITAAELERMRAPHLSARTGIAYQLTYFIASFESTRRVALHVTARSRRRFGGPSALFVLFRIVDKTSHAALHYSWLAADHGNARPEDLRRYGGVVPGAYRAADAALGELLAGAGEANVVVLSDHGFRLEGEGADRGYNHREAPPGIFIGHGPAFRPGRVDGLNVYDVFPLLAYLKALPVAEDLPGALPVAALDPAALAGRPVERVPAYALELQRARDEGSETADAEMLERLRALGYLE